MVERIFLWGFMGSGKSSSGLKLSRKLSWDFLDLDVLISSIEEKSVNEIFRDEGERYFRKKEHEVLKDVLTIPKVVVACGGGTPCYHKNVGLINASGLSIYLNVKPQFLIQRLSLADANRPLARQNEKGLRQLWEERQVFYKKAHCIVKNPDQIQKELFPLLDATGFQY